MVNDGAKILGYVEAKVTQASIYLLFDLFLHNDLICQNLQNASLTWDVIYREYI